MNEQLIYDKNIYEKFEILNRTSIKYQINILLSMKNFSNYYDLKVVKMSIVVHRQTFLKYDQQLRIFNEVNR